jgi:hypothetical protein
MPGTSLDWIALGRAGVTAIAQLPAVSSTPWLQPYVRALNTVLVPAAIVALTITLTLLCLTGRMAGGAAGRRAARTAPKHAVPG